MRRQKTLAREASRCVLSRGPHCGTQGRSTSVARPECGAEDRAPAGYERKEFNWLGGDPFRPAACFTMVRPAGSSESVPRSESPSVSMSQAAIPTTTARHEIALADVLNSRTLRTAVVLMLLWIGLALHPETREAFVTAGNLSNVTTQVAEIIVIGVGMTFVILIGGIDLSVGSGMALFGVVAAELQIDRHQPAAIAILAALVVALVVGFWHGLLVSKFKVPPFIATLSGFLAYRGFALVLSDARGLSPMGEDFAIIGGQLPPGPSLGLCVFGFLAGLAILFQKERRRREFSLPAQSTIVLALQAVAILVIALLFGLIYQHGMPVPVLIAAIVTSLGALLLRRSRLGRYAFAIGGNAEAARLSGVPVTRVTMLIYLMTAVLTALAGLIAAARTNGVTPGNMGLIRELHVITAVVIGGTSLSGGRATMLGTVLGALIFGTLSNGMNLLNVNSNWQLILTGAILLGASMLDSLSIRKEAT
jgi:D-xylose transport system permease protein